MEVAITYDQKFQHVAYTNMGLACADRIRNAIKGPGKLIMHIKDEFLMQAPTDFTLSVKKKGEGEFNVTVKVRRFGFD